MFAYRHRPKTGTGRPIPLSSRLGLELEGYATAHETGPARMPASFYDRDRRLRILNNCLMARPIGCIYVRIRGANQARERDSRNGNVFHRSGRGLYRSRICALLGRGRKGKEEGRPPIGGRGLESALLGCVASIPTIDSATIDATIAAMHPDRAVWSHASSAVYATCTDHGVSLWNEGNQYAEERRGGCGSGDYFTDHKVRS
jgi:hypothetical protein